MNHAPTAVDPRVTASDAHAKATPFVERYFQRPSFDGDAGN